MVPPLIALEEHFLSTAILTTHRSLYAQQFKHLPNLESQITSLSDVRLQQMDTGHVSIQIISHGPGTMTPTQCESANDELSAAIKQAPSRFAGFAVLPVADPASSAIELRRCVTELGFKGALIDNHAQGVYYDTEAYFPLWQAAEELGVPVYLHPTWPTKGMKDAITSELPAAPGGRGEGEGGVEKADGDGREGEIRAPLVPPAAIAGLTSSSFGWHSDVGMHFLRLFAAGTFDRFPKLKIILGHFGEMLPFMLARIVQLSPRWGERRRKFREVWDQNVWITTSGVWSVDPMACILRKGNTRVERVLYSVDYPFAKCEDGLGFMRELEESGLVDRDGLERIAWRNAAELFGLKVEKTFE